MFYLLDKRKGISSFKAIKEFAKEKGIKKVGHTGTLDPLATGLLLIATDEDTKLIDYIDKGFKSYKAWMELGKTSDTYDVDGKIKITNNIIPDFEKIKDALYTFEGINDQMPPVFSAKKINGNKAYDLARKGESVILNPSKVEIKNIKNIIMNDNIISFEVTVSRGTYIRSLIHDLGEKLGCGAIMTDLRRTEIGTLTEQDLNSDISIMKLLTLKTTSTNDMQNLVDGKAVSSNEEDGTYALEYKSDIFGIVEVVNNKLKSKKLIGNKFRKAGF